MWIVLLRRRWLWGTGAVCCCILAMAWVLWRDYAPAAPSFAAQGGDVPVTVVVDPGHGGVDGGAAAADGTLERDLNLEIGRRVADLLQFAGMPAVLTRTTEEAIHTEGDTIRERKVSDTRNRVSLVNGTENALLLSIHQNSLPSSPGTHGAFVFWNGEPGAEEAAEAVQTVLNETVNQGNEKEARRIADSVYLMNHVTAPGVLVECGFLSNAAETERLKDPAYQTRLAAAITAGVLHIDRSDEIGDRSF